jgi:hypothetical protein
MYAKRLGPVLAGLLATAGMVAAGPASAMSAVDMSAADTVRQLTDEGYSVQINGTAEVPLSECRTTGVHGIPNDVRGDMDPLRSTTVYVDISCPSDN